MRNTSPTQTLLNGATSTEVGNTFFAEPWRNVVIFTATSNSADLTVQVKGSITDDKPDFGSSAGANNLWETIQVKDLNDGSTVDGSTGYVASADEVRAFEVNTNGMRYVTVEVTSHATGTVSAFVRGYDNQ